MRFVRAAAALVFAVTVSAACSFSIDTDGLTGGVRIDAGGDAAPDGDARVCDKSSCFHDMVVVKLASFPTCLPNGTPSQRLTCREALRQHCMALNPCCFTGALGPVDFPNATEATIACLSGEAYTADASEVVDGTCTRDNLGTLPCVRSIHQAATRRGFATGILQTVASDGTLSLVGWDTDRTYLQPAVPWATLTKHDPGCTPELAESQACVTAVHRYCASADVGSVTGFGPIESTATTVAVSCLD